MKISLVLPVYKKEDEILKQIIRLENFFRDQNFKYELIIVIDGIVDSSNKLVKSYIKRTDNQNIILKYNKTNMGKGYSVRKGFLLASGDILGYIDADLDINLETLAQALITIRTDSVDAIFPSKFNTQSKQSNMRKAYSIILNMIYRNFLNINPKVTDITFGLKLFKKNVIHDIQSKLHINRFAIDAEIAYLISEKYHIEVIDGFLNKKRAKSTATNIFEIINILVDIVRIKYIHEIYNKYVINILHFPLSK